MFLKILRLGDLTMNNIYQVENSYHLMEGLDSEFLVVASSKEEAKDVCLKLLAEDQDSHIEAIKEFGPCDIHRPSFIKNFLP